MPQVRHEELICEAKIPDFELSNDHNSTLEADGDTLKNNNPLYHSQYREDTEKRSN
jgi:hypothetical protein